MNASQAAVHLAMFECAQEAGDGTCDLSAADLMTRLGIRSERTVTTARAALREAGLIELLEDAPGRRPRYRVHPRNTPAIEPPQSTPATPAIAPPQSVLSRCAPAREHTPERTVAVEGGEEEVEGTEPPQSATPAIGGTPAIGVAGVESVGRLAVAAAMESAAEAGQAPPSAGVRGRIGQTANALAATEVDVPTIIAAARRVGAGGFADLRTAVEAVKAGRSMPAAAPVVEEGARTAPVIRLILATWPRAQIDAAIWEEKLGRIQERFLLLAVDEIARRGEAFSPTWGQVWKVAHEIGQPIVGAERAERAWQRERDADAARAARLAQA